MTMHHGLLVVESSVFDYIYLFNRLVGNIDCQLIEITLGGNVSVVFSYHLNARKFKWTGQDLAS